MPTGKQVKLVYPKTRSAWRRWLQRNHASSGSIWLVFDKKSSGREDRLRYNDAVEEALCFGWIDSLVHPLDEHRYKQLFSPRRPRSKWSKLNKSRVARMIACGLMTDAGLAKIKAAKRDGSWIAQAQVDDLVVPRDLKKALSANPEARRNFESFSPSSRRGLLGWIHSAKRPETRAARIAEMVRQAAKNRRAGYPGG